MPAGSSRIALAHFLFLSLLLAVALLPVATARAEGPAGFTSARECGRCHQELFRSWEKTFHAQAVANPVFAAELERVEALEGHSARVVCLSCHSPTTNLTMDFSLSLPLSREGITCDFCHTLAAVDPTARGAKFRNEPSPVKLGPGRPDSLAAHATRKNQLLVESSFCAACHQWTNDKGLAILDTFDEWNRSFYRGEQISCQMCHMPEILKTDLLLQGRKIDRPSHLHMEMGGHSQTQLAIAATLGLDASIHGERLDAQVTVENFKGGHMLPTGLPSRSVILEVRLLDSQGKLLDRREKRFQRILGDDTGNALEGIEAWYLRASRVLEDSRIAPKEKRRVAVDFLAPATGGPFIVEARLTYRLKVANLSPPFLDYEMATAKKVVNGQHKGAFRLTGGLPLVIALALLALVGLILTRLRVRPD